MSALVSFALLRDGQGLIQYAVSFRKVREEMSAFEPLWIVIARAPKGVQTAGWSDTSVIP